MIWAERTNDWATNDWSGYTWKSPDQTTIDPADSGLWFGMPGLQGRLPSDQPDRVNVTGAIAVGTLNLLQPGVVAGALARSSDPGFQEELKQAFDANADGALALDELLDVAGTLAALRQLAGISEPDPLIVAIVRRALRQLREDLLPPNSGETALPAIQKDSLTGAPFPLLALVPPDSRYAALELLRSEVTALDSRPAPAGDMTSNDEQVNQRRLATLLGIVDGLPPLLRFGRVDELTQTLVKLRDVVARDDRAWVRGEAARAIDAAILRALQLLASHR
jgi:hypothetical protein